MSNTSSLLLVLARILLSFMFILAGFGKLADPAGTAGKFDVYGSLSGVHTWTASVATNRVTLALPKPFVAGEKVDVSVVSGLKGIGFLQLANGYNYGYELAAARGSANFTRELIGTSNAFHTDVVVGDLNGDGLPDAITVNNGKTTNGKPCASD